MQPNPPGCVKNQKNHKKSISDKDPLKRVANRGFSHHKCLVGFPNGPPHPDLGSFATLKVGCVISLNLISEKNPLKRVANRGFSHHKCLVSFPNGPPPPRFGLICNPESRVCHFTEPDLRKKTSEKGCEQTSQMPCRLPKWTPPPRFGLICN